MAAITTEAIKELREKTGAGVMDCRRALQQADGDVQKAIQVLHAQGLERAGNKAGRVARQGVVESFVHLGRVGAIVELNCETDFVARDEGFRALAREVAQHIVGVGRATEFVAPEDAPADMPEEEKREKVLLLQPFIKNPGQTIQQLIIERASRFGENVRIGRFARLEIGEES